MKNSITILALFLTQYCFSQANDSLKIRPGRSAGFVSFVTKLDITNATKDGIYLNGYVVNIGYEKAKQLHGKKIRVSGRAKSIKGLKNRPGNKMQQGREEDYKYIGSPKIEIIEG